ncbi:glycosyltransferase, partial [Bacteroidota bacterium]
ANHASIYNKASFVVNGPCQIENFLSYKNSIINTTNQDRKIILGWIGSPETLFYLYKIYDALELIGEKYPNVILKLVGTGKERFVVPPFEKIKVDTVPTYNQNEMIKQVYSFDIGLYPLFYNELSLGRGSLKATIYMAGGIPVVCSSIGENTKIIKDGNNGLLADDTDEWFEKLSLLIENPILRKKIGENGNKYAATNFSINNCLNHFLEIIDKCS